MWDDQTGYYSFKQNPYAYRKDSNGKFVALNGTKVKRVSSWGEEEVEKGVMYESDVPIYTRTLIDKYHDSDEVSQGHKKMIFDIETEVNGAFPDSFNPTNKITAISFYDEIMDEYVGLILDPDNKIDNVERDQTVIVSFISERELLEDFLRRYLEIQPTILTGWNTNGFDIPYLYNRIVKVLGKEYANVLSPINKVIYSPHREQYQIAGVAAMDYLDMYKLFTYSEKSSYTLNAIGKEEVGLGKVEYEGSLDDLYKTDVNKFIEYNLNDVIIVKKIDDKLKYIDLVRAICHKGHVPYEDIKYPSRYIEGAILTYMRRLGVIAPNKGGSELGHKNANFVGAYVKDPVPGRYEWLYSLDVQSLYPNIMMTLNISPETKVGKIKNWQKISMMSKIK